MAIGRPIPVLTLSDDEREALERWARRLTTVQALPQRARVVLGARPAARTLESRANCV